MKKKTRKSSRIVACSPRSSDTAALQRAVVALEKMCSEQYRLLAMQAEDINVRRGERADRTEDMLDRRCESIENRLIDLRQDIDVAMKHDFSNVCTKINEVMAYLVQVNMPKPPKHLVENVPVWKRAMERFFPCERDRLDRAIDQAVKP